MSFELPEEPRLIRRRLGLNQQQFWSILGVTQSGGSRYENGRTMPAPVRELVRIVHVEQIDIQEIQADDWMLIKYLKEVDPEFLKGLKRKARSWGKQQGQSRVG